MKLHQLQALVAVVDEGGIRAAARALHLSQAALTKAMRQLEDECGTALLLRRSRGIELTEAGSRLLARARLVARQVELAGEELQQAAGEDAGHVRVGITPYVTMGPLGEAFRWFRKRYRSVQVQVIEGLVARVLPRLRDGTLDLAVVAVDTGEVPDEFTATHLLRAPQRIVVREQHPVLKKPSAEALVACEWALTAPLVPGGPGREEAMFAAAGVPLPNRVLLCETLAAMALLRASDLVSLMPAPLLGHPESRGIVAVPDTALVPCDIELKLLARPEIPLTPAAAYFARCLVEAIGG